MCASLLEKILIHVTIVLVSFGKQASCIDCRCGVKDILEKRIIGGETVFTKQYPWMVYIQLHKPYFCGGVIINDLYVLTADHCMKVANGLNFSVYLHTTHRTKSKGTKYNPVKVITFDNNPSGPRERKDVALIKLDRRIDVDTVPICLPNPESKYTHLNVSVLGWGKLKSGIASNLLQKAKLTVMSDDYCRNSSISKHYNNKLMLCAYSDGKDSCQGDSGGPLFYNSKSNTTAPKYELVGLVSWGIKCGIGAPGVYSKISHYVNWILNRTKDANYCVY